MKSGLSEIVDSSLANIKLERERALRKIEDAIGTIEFDGVEGIKREGRYVIVKSSQLINSWSAFTYDLKAQVDLLIETLHSKSIESFMRILGKIVEKNGYVSEESLGTDTGRQVYVFHPKVVEQIKNML
jgi:hypothetical protein